MLYITSRTFSSDDKKSSIGAIAGIIALVSWLAYVVSQFIVLLLSRVREYYADQFSAQATQEPNQLSTALVKVAYGLARAPEGGDKKDDMRMIGARALGIFDPRSATALALTSAGQGGTVSPQTMENAMRWDLWNPWGGWFELNSTHPLAAKRIRELGKMSLALNKATTFSFREERPESYWDEFAVDLFVNFLPLIGFLVGLVAAFALILFLSFPAVTSFGIGIIVWGFAIWLNRRFSYPTQFDTARKVSDLVAEIKVSEVRPVTGKLTGKIIGRGVPGLFYSSDLVLQDESGFMGVQYRQPLQFLEFLVGWVKAATFIGKTGTAYGWFRRAPAPRFEMRRIEFTDGHQVTSYLYPVAQFFLYAFIVLGIVMAIVGFVIKI